LGTRARRHLCVGTTLAKFTEMPPKRRKQVHVLAAGAAVISNETNRDILRSIEKEMSHLAKSMTNRNVKLIKSSHQFCNLDSCKFNKRR
jgi:hypothetical protein